MEGHQVATGQIQSQLRRHLSLFLLVGCLSGLAAPAAIGEEAQRGGPFFILADASYGSKETAQVRFEAVDQGAVAAFGGADIYVYRVPKPLEFLQKQKNLHRVRIDGNYQGEGLANALSTAWDAWITRSREAWRGLFTKEARQEVLAEAPELKAGKGFGAPTRYQQNPQYQPIKGLELKDSFRYPVAVAKPIAPPADVKLAGSSSEFMPTIGGNIMIPIGKRAPGLYLVEAVVGQHRATTLVFVADTVAITKISSGQLLAWTANRKSGEAVAGSRIVWSDGVGVLKSEKSDKRGIAVLERPAPEQTYVFGEDPAGGVFVSENFYYDSEIYNTKLYAVTDRPLYRPGDHVFIKVMGREFTSARNSTAVAAGDLEVEVYDPNGLPVSRQRIAIRPEAGADTSFLLPDNAPAGGYEIRFAYKGDRYGAAFRVAQYQKPHFEISFLPDKADFRTGEPISGRIQLTYPDGKPVKRAAVELAARSQQMTMVDGDLGYSGQFPLKLAEASLTTDDKGMATFSLPPATQPSRYVLTALATDGAAYRVRVSRELLVERAAGAYTIKAEREFSFAGEAVAFSATAAGEPGANAPVRWELIRLENRKRYEGPLQNFGRFEIQFPDPGSYSLVLRDAHNNVVGAASHFVGGAGGKAPAGSIGIVFDKAEYQAGETAEALITFPVEVAEALLTLERDKVEQSALLKDKGDWLNLKRETATQWRIRIPVKDEHGPNITFSVAYVKDGDYVFQNQGLRVTQAKVQVEFKTDKTVYAPGEKVNVEVRASSRGKPVAASIAVGVVDEMIYVLQPEIAPDIFDFFYHPRRNNVRTSASLAFVGYDLAQPHGGSAPSRHQVNERATKVLERPRREEVDTAFWNPQLVTNAEGKASFSFVMPDSLTRWRITARAMDAAGVVGQKLAWLRSEKPVYVKWTSPDWRRENDAPVASVALFNQTQEPQAVQFVAQGGGADKRENLTLKPGANFVQLPLQKSQPDGRPLLLSLLQQGKTVDSFQVTLKQEPLAWSGARTLAVELKGKETALSLPADARNLRLRFASGADAQIARIADDLIDFPYGCIEQTSSRLIPLTLAIQSLAGVDTNAAPLLRQKLYSQRFSLAQMAGPNAQFTWWGGMGDGDPFLTAYAYYADWLATRALGITLPQSHWDRLLDTYAKQGGYKLPPLQRALVLFWMQDIGLPVGSLQDALADDLVRADGAPTRSLSRNSLVMAEPDSRRAIAAARVLTAQMRPATRARLAATESLDVELLRGADAPFQAALLLYAGKLPATEAPRVLGQVRRDMPTFERAMALLWSYRALGGHGRAAAALPAPLRPWVSESTASGATAYVLPTQAGVPNKLALADKPAGAVTAFIDHDSRAQDAPSLPVVIERKLYRLVKGEAKREAQPATEAYRGHPAREADVAAVRTEFELQLVGNGEALRTDEVYLDEVVLHPSNGDVMRYGLVEVALPPGASVERGTWGISLRQGEQVVAIEKARNEDTRTGYAVPVESLSGEVKLRHLVRFAEKGRFELPPARFHRMYQPEQKAYEAKDHAWTQVRVE
jgi:uncharacterized protein YfaS (alpha-2-macroglobulin family)